MINFMKLEEKRLTDTSMNLTDNDFIQSSRQLINNPGLPQTQNFQSPGFSPSAQPFSDYEENKMMPQPFAKSPFQQVSSTVGQKTYSFRPRNNSSNANDQFFGTKERIKDQDGRGKHQEGFMKNSRGEIITTNLRFSTE